jgi:hypothetical protein
VSLARLYILYLYLTYPLPQTQHLEHLPLIEPLSVHEEPDIAASYLQHHLSALQNWFEKWRIKINANKSCYITFILRKRPTIDVRSSGNQIPRKTEIKYLGMIIDSKLTWKQHVVKKQKQIDLTIKQMHWLIGRKSKLSVENTILIFKALIIPIWTYDVELWGCASKSNTSIIQSSQSKFLRMIVEAPWYVYYATLHADLSLSSVQDAIQQRSNKHHNKIKTQENPLLKTLMARDDSRRLKRNWPIDLI